MRNKIKKLLYLIKNFRSIKYNYLNDIETLKYMLKNNKGIIRWGDGETSIALNQPIYFQEANIDLANSMNEIIDSYSEESPFILALPNEFLTKNILSYNLRTNFIWLKSRGLLRKKIKSNVIYGDSFLFRNYIIKPKQLYEDLFEQIWSKFNVFIIVSGNYIDLNDTMKFFSNKSIYRVQIPKENAYKVIDNIEFSIDNVIAENNLKYENTSIIFSGGPVAKILAYKYSNRGYTCYDIGFFANPHAVRKKYNLYGENINAKN